MNYGLPATAEIGGKEVSIRTDFRVILDILESMNDPGLSDGDKGEAALEIFYPDLEAVTDYEAALGACLRFIDGPGEARKQKKSPRLMDWEHDFDHIIAPVNRVLGYEARGVPYREWYDEETGEWHSEGGLHWWTFLAAYMEIGGECAMSQIVNIRDKLARGKKLEKHERDWYRRNRELVDLPQKLSDAEDAILKEWT